jgi:hypothetical protein
VICDDSRPNLGSDELESLQDQTTRSPDSLKIMWLLEADPVTLEVQALEIRSIPIQTALLVLEPAPAGTRIIASCLHVLDDLHEWHPPSSMRGCHSVKLAVDVAEFSALT